MAALSDQHRTRVLALLREGSLDREAIASEVGVSPGTVSAIKANWKTTGGRLRPHPMHHVLLREAMCIRIVWRQSPECA